MNFLPSTFDGSLELYFRIIREGMAVRSHCDLLKWLQGEVQHYLPHKIMLAVWIGTAENQVEYDVVSALPGIRTGFLHSEKLLTLQQELYSLWIALGKVPYRQSLDAHDSQSDDYTPPCTTGEIFCGMRSLLVHGASDERMGQDCLYIIFNSKDSFDDTTLGVMESLLPYLDNALRRIKPWACQHQTMFPSENLLQSRKNYGLSRREAEIMDWVRMGKTNSEIASILGISACTVRNHLQSIFKKLNVFNRVQAIAKVGPTPIIANPPLLSPSTAPLRANPINISSAYRSSLEIVVDRLKG
ncbi:XrtB/PEP-CTERM-associated transcriptional regulator EpsA [Nitrosomonas sp.]|uniref:XrtB/PEP-CTERM-associated transcriptional regulator EpsA n=1 Tax=Nitrosomonas sp. TaxID=42353 RepID=UPI0025E4C786|nr:XrtB/PEP-CTERM-associated transcriptional regulator EpsA [Nitrosomonas sp.]